MSGIFSGVSNNAQEQLSKYKTAAENFDTWNKRVEERLKDFLNENLYVRKDYKSSDYLQKQSGAGPCCAYAYAMGISIIDGKKGNDKYKGKDYYNGTGATGMKRLEALKAWSKDSFDTIYKQIKGGKPVIIHYYTDSKRDSESQNQHWVLAVGIKKDADIKNLTSKDIIILDSATGKEVTLTSGYSYSKMGDKGLDGTRLFTK